MRSLLYVISLLFVLAAAAAFASVAAPQSAGRGTAAAPVLVPGSLASEAPKNVQSPAPGESKPKMSPAEMQRISDEYFKQCMQDWDPATHMTKKDWERTCRRVVDNRVKFMIEQMGK